MAQNPGKIFEQSIKDSVPNTCWIYRFRDNAASFGNGNNTSHIQKEYYCLSPI